MAIAGAKQTPAAAGGLFMTVTENNQTNLPGLVERQPEITQRPERSSVVDTNYVPATHLLAHVEGSNWTVTYYKQQLGLADELKPLQIGTSPAHQQYQQISQFNLKVNTALSQSQDEETKEFQVTGEATVYYSLIPNVGDMFVADVGDGTAGLFTVTECERMSYSKDTCYRIAYVMISPITDAQQADLDLKSTSKVVFDLTMLELLDNPFLVETDYNRLVSLHALDEKLRRHLMERFWSPDVQTLKVPQQQTATYDGYHALYARSIGLGDYSKPIRIYHNGISTYDAVASIWGLLSDMSSDGLPYVHPTFGSAFVKTFQGQPVARGIAYSPFKYSVYPNGNYDYIDEHFPRVESEPLQMQLPNQPFVTPPFLNQRPYINAIDCDNCYVFSQAFYDMQADQMSVLERMIFNMLSGVAVDPTQVLLLGNYVPKMRPLEQFYYIPMILALINFTRRNEACQ